MNVERDNLPARDLRDDAVLAGLRRIVSAVDGLPGSVVDAARAAFLTRDLDSEIAALIADSYAAGEDAYEPARAQEDPAQGQWLLSFEGGGLHIDLEIEGEPGHLRMLGQLAGVPVVECTLQSEGGPVAVRLDSLRRFIVDGLSHGPIRLLCVLSDDRRISTSWVTI